MRRAQSPRCKRPSKNCKSLKEVWKIKTGKVFPEDPYRQLELSINAVLKSWSGKQATDYRKFSGIPPEMANGTAVIIMTMVFGNLGSTSMSGIAFTRSPESGEKKLYGEYLINSQGEELVSGRLIPCPIEKLSSEFPKVEQGLETLPKLWKNNSSNLNK